MSQDQRPARVRLTRVAQSPGSAIIRHDDEEESAAPAAAPPAPAPARSRLIDWRLIALFIVACLIGGMLTAVFDLPSYLLS